MSAVKGRRARYSEATKAALVEAATRRFAEHGFAATSLEDVAADIEASRGAVYHHFESKLALFQAVFEQQESQMISMVIEAAAQAATPWESMEAALEAFLSHCCEPVYGRIVWKEALIALGWQRWKECEEKYAYGMIEEFLTNLVDADELPPLPREPMARITFQLLGAAGLAIAEAAPADKAQTKADYALVINRILAGTRRRPR